LFYSELAPIPIYFVNVGVYDASQVDQIMVKLSKQTLSDVKYFGIQLSVFIHLIAIYP